MTEINYSGKYDVFLSYRRDGGETMAVLLRDRLAAKGYRVFLDVEALNPGSFNEQLLDVIGHCTDFLLVCSKDSLKRCKNEGDWVRREIAHALKQGKNVIPFMLRGFAWPKKLPGDIAALPMQNGVTADSNVYFDAAIDLLCSRFLKSGAVGQAREGGAPQAVDAPEKPALTSKGVTVGDTITFGAYAWRVLEVRDGKGLIITKDILERRPYNTEYIDVSWENCTLHSHLNSVFLGKFSEREQDVIDGEIFLLSVGEAMEYFSTDDDRIAKRRGEAGGWWLRSPGLGLRIAASVDFDGSIYRLGYNLYSEVGVRPAMWIKL